MAEQQWYYHRLGQNVGPMLFRELQQLAATGQVQPSDLVWHQGLASWVHAQSVPQLFGETKASEPPPPALPVTTVAPIDEIGRSTVNWQTIRWRCSSGRVIGSSKRTYASEHTGRIREATGDFHISSTLVTRTDFFLKTNQGTEESCQLAVDVAVRDGQRVTMVYGEGREARYWNWALWVNHNTQQWGYAVTPEALLVGTGVFWNIRLIVGAVVGLLATLLFLLKQTDDLMTWLLGIGGGSALGYYIGTGLQWLRTQFVWLRLAPNLTTLAHHLLKNTSNIPWP